MIVRQAEPADLEGLAAIEKQGIASPWSGNQLEEELRHPSSLILVAEPDDCVCGNAFFRIVASDAELLRLPKNCSVDVCFFRGPQCKCSGPVSV